MLFIKDKILELDPGEVLTKEDERIRCQVVFEETRTCGYRYLKQNLIPENSIPITDNGLTHLLNLDKGKLSYIDYVPTDNKSKTPQDCMEATSWEELAGILGIGLPTIEKIKLGIFVGLCAAFTVVLFLISVVAMG